MTTPAFDAVSDGTFASGTTKTVSHTPVGSSNLIAIAALATTDRVSAISVTYDGVAMTLITNGSVQNTNNSVYVYYLLAPPAGAKNVIASWTTSTSGALTVRTYANIHQTTPFGTGVGATGSSLTPTVDVSSATGELVIDCADHYYGSASVGAGQTSRYNNDTGTGHSGSDEAGAATVTMSWSIPSFSGQWAIFAVPLKPAPAATFVPQVIMV